MKPTTEQVRQWAREAGIKFLTHEGISGKLNTLTRGSQPIENIEAALAIAYAAGAAAMKERTAKVCADMWCKEPEPGDARDCYDAIRALGDKDE